MIQEIITYYCNECESTNIEKNGTDYKSSQKYHCLDCNAYGTVHPQTLKQKVTCSTCATFGASIHQSASYGDLSSR